MCARTEDIDVEEKSVLFPGDLVCTVHISARPILIIWLQFHTSANTTHVVTYSSIQQPASEISSYSVYKNMHFIRMRHTSTFSWRCRFSAFKATIVFSREHCSWHQNTTTITITIISCFPCCFHTSHSSVLCNVLILLQFFYCFIV